MKSVRLKPLKPELKLGRKPEVANLLSESTENYPPIIIHPDDKYLVNGIVKYVVKKIKAER